MYRRTKKIIIIIIYKMKEHTISACTIKCKLQKKGPKNNTTQTHIPADIKDKHN